MPKMPSPKPMVIKTPVTSGAINKAVSALEHRQPRVPYKGEPK